MNAKSPLAYIYPVLAADPNGEDADIVGLTYLDSYDPVSSEIRVNISPHVSRVVMRITKAVIPAMYCRGEPATVWAWECLNTKIAVNRGFLRLFAKWNPVPQKEIEAIQSEFWMGVEQYFDMRLMARKNQKN